MCIALSLLSGLGLKPLAQEGTQMDRKGQRGSTTGCGGREPAAGEYVVRVGVSDSRGGNERGTQLFGLRRRKPSFTLLLNVFEKKKNRKQRKRKKRDTKRRNMPRRSNLLQNQSPSLSFAYISKAIECILGQPAIPEQFPRSRDPSFPLFSRI